MGKMIDMVISDKTRAVLSIANIAMLIIVVWTGAVTFSGIKNDIKKNNDLIIYNTSDIDENKSNIKSNTDDNIVLKVSVAKINTNLERLIFSVDRLTEKK